MKKINAESGELIIESSNGNLAIIPKDKREYIQELIKSNKHKEIDKFVSGLPRYSDYAEDGTLLPINDPKEVLIEKDGNVKSYDISSPEYKKLYDSGKLMTYDKADDTYIAPELEEFTVTAKKNPSIGGMLRKWGKETGKNPAKSFIGAIEQGIGGLFQLPQAAATYAATGGDHVTPGAALKNTQFTNLMQGLGNTNVPESLIFKAMGSEMGQNIVLDPLNVPVGGILAKSIGTIDKLGDLKGISSILGNIGKNKLSKADKVIDATKVGSKVLNKTDDVGKQASKQWQLEELPGLHLQSTMSTNPKGLHTQVSKDGKIHVENALKFIGKESGGKEKVEIIRQALGDNLPQKMDYNEFRKVVQDQLIPLEKKVFSGIDPHYNDPYGSYGVHNVGIDVNSPNIKTYKLTFSNKDKFGRGSSAHGNPEETLGHFHITEDADIPNTIIATELQADPFQGTHRIMPKNTTNALERQQKSLVRMEELQERNKSVLNKMKTEGVDEAGLPVQEYQIKQFEDIVKAQEQSNLFKKADIENFTQKQLLDKNHQERYLQELVDYAGKRGDIDKVRVPTSETAAKVQGYKKTKIDDNSLLSEDEFNEFNNLAKKYDGRPDNLSDTELDNTYLPIRKRLDELNRKREREIDYEPKDQTILKRYEDNPKLIKKLFGEEPKIVTDSKGNTWYEFDIPKKFKEGKGEIKAFTTVGAIGTGAALSNQFKNKTEQ